MLIFVITLSWNFIANFELCHQISKTVFEIIHGQRNYKSNMYMKDCTWWYKVISRDYINYKIICLLQSFCGNHLIRISFVHQMILFNIDDEISWNFAALQMFTHSSRDKMGAILQTTFSNVFSSMKMLEKFWLKFHWSLSLRVQLKIFQHWFRLWLGAD